MKIKEMDYIDKPRERALNFGFQSLSNAELIALIVRSGMKGKSALVLANEILATFHSIKLIRSRNIEDLCALDGMGEAKSISLLAAVELSFRISNESVTNEKKKIGQPTDIFDFMKNYKFNIYQEEFYVICLNARKEIIAARKMFVGTVETTIIHPRDIYKYAIANNSSYVVFTHNHPTGDITPSPEDIDVTKKLINCGDLMNVKVLDHIIYSSETFFSFRENGLM